MANTIAGTVIRCDTTAAFPLAINVTGFKYVGGASGAVTVRADSASGAVVYEAAGTTTLDEDKIYMRQTGGLHVTVTGTCALYIYLK